MRVDNMSREEKKHQTEWSSQRKTNTLKKQEYIQKATDKQNCKKKIFLNYGQ